MTDQGISIFMRLKVLDRTFGFSQYLKESLINNWTFTQIPRGFLTKPRKYYLMNNDKCKGKARIIMLWVQTLSNV